MRYRAALAAIALVALTGCTQQEIATWLAWHDEAPEAAVAYANRPDVQESLHQDWDHDGIIEPDPLPPPPQQAQSSGSTASTGNSCTGLIGALSGYGWDANRMARIAYRESRCQPDAANSCCTGLFQIHEIWIPKASSCDVYSRADLTNPSKNICTAAIVYRSQGMGAWGG